MGSSDQLIEDLSSEKFQHGAQQGFWKFVERKDWKVYVRMYAPDERSYLLELDCSSYGDEPIRGLFVDFETKQCIASVWPQGNSIFEQWVKFKGDDHFICWNQDRAGLEHHSEWRALKAWKKPNQLWNYLNFIRQLLNLESKGYARQTQTTD